MKTRTFAAAVATVALCSLLQPVAAVPEDNTVHYKFEKRGLGSFHPNDPRRMFKRQTVNVNIDNYELLYLINVTVGDPAQPIALQLDTGSSDIWFPDKNTTPCQTNPDYCDGLAYSRDDSTTDGELDYPAFRIAYVDGTEIRGTYFTDTLSLGETSVTNLTMAVADDFDRYLGVMGIGFQSGESSNSLRQPFTYPNIINVLKDQGKISSLSYSLWLDDLESNTGSILFGGVDKDKYEGSLVSLPILKNTARNDYTTFAVAWTGLQVTGSGNDQNLSPTRARPAILDSGTTLTYLPDDIANQIYTDLGVVSYQNGRVNALPCSIANDDLTFTYTFGGSEGASIRVPLRELIIPLRTRDGSIPTANGQRICQFGIAPAGNYPILFGDTFLRSAYVVYDLENFEIGLAQTNFEAQPGSGNVVAIETGIPDVGTAATAASAENTYTTRPMMTAGVTNTFDDLGQSMTRTASISLTPTSDSGASGGGQNAAGRPAADNPTLAILGVTLGAFFFGAMLT